MLDESGIDRELVQSHREHVQFFLKSGGNQTFPVLDTCRLDNGGILKCPESTQDDGAGFVSFIPAAGASSRWHSVLSELIVAISSRNVAQVKEAITNLKTRDILKFPLPLKLRELFTHVDETADFDFDELLRTIESPKALYPAVIDGFTFLQMKCLEDACFSKLSGRVVVCPDNMAPIFTHALKQYATREVPSVVYEQNGELTTVRFDRDLSICIDEKQKISQVPSGHGALARLFPRVKAEFLDAESLWIRNVDNVIGTRNDARSATLSFFGAHATTLRLLREVRGSLALGNMEVANKFARSILDFWQIDDSPLLRSKSPSELHDAVNLLIQKLFHVTLDGKKSKDDYLAVLSRPLVTMGHVPNSGKDVGGTAVFANVGGVRQKLCLEVPHASDDDRKKYLEDAAKATHFNPVFVAVEIPSVEQAELWKKHPFWLVAQKKWRGHDVFYQESILYELIGSSAYVNVVFTEIPRFLFNPHKSLADAGSRYLSDWIDS